MDASRRRLDISANNVANALTPGFKARRADQVDMRTGGTRVAATSRDNSPGPLILGETRTFDMAVAGEGFFRVETPRGPRFARAGMFKVDSAGSIVDSSGNLMSPPVTIPEGAIGFNVDVAGKISVVMGDGTTADIGTVTLTRFPNPGGLVEDGDSLLSMGPASGDPIEGTPGTEAFGSVRFGFLEGSNTDIVRETVEQITDVRTFEANANAVKAKDEMIGRVIDLKG